MLWSLNKRELIKPLLDRGADVNVKNDKGKTSLDLAKEFDKDGNHREIIEILEVFGG